MRIQMALRLPHTKQNDALIDHILILFVIKPAPTFPTQNARIVDGQNYH